MDQQIGPACKIHKRWQIGGVTGKDDMPAGGAEGQGETVNQRRVNGAHRTDAEAINIIEGAFRDFMDGDQPGKWRAAFIHLAQFNIGCHRLAECVPVILQAGWPPDGQRCFQPGCPGGMHQGPQFQIMVGMQMGDHDGLQMAQINLLVDQPAGHAKTAIHDNLLAADLDQG